MNEWKMVPVEPSDEMLDAGAKAWLSDDLRRSSTLYRAMISAAPPVDAQPVAYIRKDQVQQALRSGPFLCRVHPNHDDGFGLVPFYFDAPPVPAAVDAEWFSLVMGAAAEIEDAARSISDPDAKRVALSGAKHYREKAKAIPRPSPADASPAGDRELDLYDEIECDLPYLFGRASIEGHESGQRLAVQVKAKMRKARAALAQPAAPVAQERSHRAEVSDDALRQGLRTIIEYPVTHTDNMDAMNIKNIALDTLSRAALEQKT